MILVHVAVVRNINNVVVNNLQTQKIYAVLGFLIQFFVLIFKKLWIFFFVSFDNFLLEIYDIMDMDVV